MAAAAVSTTGRLTYNYLGRTGLKVSNICLGTMTFGPIPEGAAYYGRPGNCDEKLTHALLDRYVQWGGNFIDTADVYQKGMSEKFLGSWLVKQNRDNLVIATKVGLIMHNKLNGSYLSRKHILASVDASLRRLQTDYIDLYQIHQGDPGTPMEEYLSALNDLVRVGKVRYLGGSNLAGWEIQKINELCKSNNWEGFASLQQQYNLLNRESELEAFEVCKNEGIGVLPWSPLKGGMLSGKISRGMKDLPEGSRVRWASEEGSRATNSHPALQLLDRHHQGWGILDALHDISQQTGRSVAQISIKWLLQKKIVSSVVIGAKTLQQMDDNLEAGTEWELTANQMRALDEASQYAIPYPYDYTRAWQAARSRTSE